MTNSPIKALIVDDEELARRGLNIRLRNHSDVEIVGEACNGREALAMVRELKPDLMFLDIQMPGLDGFDVLRALKDDMPPAVVFATAYDQYAIDAFDACALDYLLKPIEPERLTACLERVRETLTDRAASGQLDHLMERLAAEDIDVDAFLENQAEQYVEMLPIRDGRRTIRLKVAEIEYVEAAGDYMCIHSQGETHVARGTMASLAKTLDPRRFSRIHRSTLVNIERVTSLRPHMNGEYFLTLDCGAEVKLSRSYRDCLKQLTAAR